MASYYLFGYAGYLAYAMSLNPLWIASFAFVVWGITMDACYHVVFMKREYRFKLKWLFKKPKSFKSRDDLK